MMDSQEDRAAMIGWDRGFGAVDYGDLGDRARAGESVRMPDGRGRARRDARTIESGARRDARTSARKDRRGRIVAGAGVAAVEMTEASKLTTAPFGARPVSATYVSQGSCPVGCRWGSWNGGGCYAEQGPTGRVTRRLGAEWAGGLSGADPATAGAGSLAGDDAAMALTLARREADAIDQLSGVGGRPLRLHIVGDCRTDAAAWIVASAANRYRARGGGLVWTYTHGAKDVDRDSWGPGVSVLGSCETDADVREAVSRGYVPALVRDFDAPRPEGGIPCPQQTGEHAGIVDCASCLMCARDTRLAAAGKYIVLAPHGPGGKPTKAMRAKLDRIQAEAAEGAAGELGAF